MFSGQLHQIGDRSQPYMVQQETEQSAADIDNNLQSTDTTQSTAAAENFEIVTIKDKDKEKIIKKCENLCALNVSFGYALIIFNVLAVFLSIIEFSGVDITSKENQIIREYQGKANYTESVDSKEI